jgi:hypothetical protein
MPEAKFDWEQTLTDREYLLRAVYAHQGVEVLGKMLKKLNLTRQVRVWIRLSIIKAARTYQSSER